MKLADLKPEEDAYQVRLVLNELLQAASSGKKKLYPIRQKKLEYPDLLEFHLSNLRWMDIFSDDQ